MFHLPKILVCSDFSEGSDKALIAAKALAHTTKGEIHLLHVAELSFYLNLCGTIPTLDQSFQENFRKDLVALLHDQAVRCGVVAQVNVQVSSDITSGVMKEVELLRPDIVFIGKGEQEGLEKFFFGDIAKKLASRVTTPLFIIRKSDAFTTSAALVDGGEESGEIIKAAHELSHKLSMNLKVLSLLHKYPGLYSGNIREYSSAVAQAISSGTEIDVKNHKAELMKILPAKDTPLLVAASFERDLGHHLNEILQDEDIHLVVMKRHHHSRLERFFIGSVSSRVMELYNGNILLL